MKALSKALHIPWVACLLISFVVLAVVLVVRGQGWLQQPELIVYDQLIRKGSDPKSTDDRIALVGMTEDDLVKYGFPIGDAMMARVLEGVAAQGAIAIGLDMYRDLPEPRNGSEYPQIEAAFKKLENLVAIERLGYVKPPPALAEAPERISLNNFPKDFTIDGYYRRAPLFIEADGQGRISLSLLLTLMYLSEKNVEIAMPEAQGQPVRFGQTAFQRVTPDAGGYVGLRVDDYEYLARFRGPRTHRVQDERGQSGRDTPYDYSFGDVIEGRVPAGAFKDKIVLVATVMQSIKDSSPTPIDDNLRGVQMHEMMINQLLDVAMKGERPLGWWPEWAELLWIAACTLLGGWLGLVFRSPWKLAPALVLLLGGIVFSGWWFFDRHDTWILVVAPALGGAIAATFVTSFIAYLEKSERGDMQALFSKHVSPTVVEALWEQREAFLDGGRMKPQRVTATVLFTDLKGFSTTSEKMDPATLMDWMNEYMNDIARHVDEHGGMINKFIGDAIMAVFGVPVFRTSEAEFDLDATRAVECALAMRRELHRLNLGWAARGLPTTAMRIGIYTGPLVAGSMGSKDRLEFTVLGDTVNTGARLEAAGKDAPHDDRTAECMILIGDSTCQRLHGKFETVGIGAMSLKGKADKIIVHSVIAALPAATSEIPKV